MFRSKPVPAARPSIRVMPFNPQAGVDLNERYAAAAAPPAVCTDIWLNASDTNGAGPAVDEPTFYSPGSPGMIRKPNDPLPPAPMSPPPRRTTGVLAYRKQAATPPPETCPGSTGSRDKSGPRAETSHARTRVTETVEPVYKTAEDSDSVTLPVYKTFEPRDNAQNGAPNAAAAAHINMMAAQLRKIAAGKVALDKSSESNSISSHGDAAKNLNCPSNRRHLWHCSPSTSKISAAPVRSMSNTTSDIEAQRWFHGNILRNVAEARLKAMQAASQCSNGIYLVREKVKNESYVLSVFSPACKSDVEHILIEKPTRAGNATVNYYQISGYPRASFASVIEIVHALSRDARLSEAITQRHEVLLRQACHCTAELNRLNVGKDGPQVISAVLPCQYSHGRGADRKPNYPSHRPSYSLSPSPPTALAI